MALNILISIFLFLILVTFSLIYFFLKNKELKPSLKSLIHLAMIASISLSLYAYLGYYKDMNEYYSPHAIHTRNKMVEARNLLMHLKKQEFRLRIELEKNNQNAAKWWELGEIYEAKEQLNNAAVAYKKAFDLEPENLNILIHYLTLQCRITKGVLSKEDKILTKNLLLNKSYQSAAYNLLAMDAFQSKKFAKAIRYWDRILETLKPESSLALELNKMKDIAKKNLNI